MIYPKDYKLQIGYQPNYDKDYHIDIPLEAKIKQNYGMTKWLKLYL